MWLALVFYCLTPTATSCTLIANTNMLHASEEACNRDAYEVADSFMYEGVYARAYCLKIGQST